MRRSAARHLLPVALTVLVALIASLVLAACESSKVPSAMPSADGAASALPAITLAPPGSDAARPSLTPVPGGQTLDPGPLPTRIGTAQTEWGEILVALPASFPVHPEAGFVDLPGTATASLAVPVDLEVTTDWYVEALGSMGYQLDLSDPLESGTRVLDVASDVPECRIRIDFRPVADSTIMTVLYGAGCAGLGG